MRRTTLGGKVFRAVLWVAFGLFFLFPLYAMADFSTRNLIAGGRTLQAWTEPRRRRSAVPGDRDLAAAGGFHRGGDAA